MNEQWQELKETIIEMRDNDGIGTQQEVCKFLANLMDVLEKQIIDEWIPVSERLPKNDEVEVLITLKEDGSVLQATYLDDRTFDTEAYGWFAIKNISAWMPLPKPYKESEDSK